MVLGTNFLAACFELSIFRSITISKRTATASGPRQKEFFGGSLFFSLNFISHLKTVKYPKESPDILFWRIGGTRKIVYTQISIRYSLKYFHLNSGPESD